MTANCSLLAIFRVQFNISTMQISDDTLIKLLERNKVATHEQLQPLIEVSLQNETALKDVVLAQGIIEEKKLTQLFATYVDFPFINLDPQSIPSDTLRRIPERIARQYRAVVFQIDEDETVHLATDDPDDVQAISFLQKEIGTNAKIYIATESNILECLEAYRSNVDQELRDVIDIQREDGDGDQQAAETEFAEDSPIAQTVNLLLEYAIRSNASDVHVEPREEFVQVRYRIDGVLTEVNRLPRNVLGALVSRIKILSNLKIDERRVPQDGRFKVTVAGKRYALRVSTLPITDGEKVVMRILDESNKTLTLENLGYWGRSLEIINDSIKEPNGMILITGPTGSGKSTSLFSLLSMLNTPDVNISTIEDPVEYKIPGVNQTQTNAKAGMTFANGLRALLRQDPNIIMVGEIRDSETADLGVQAALTGHLVFSTLHTNDAATCLPRLLDMGIEPFLIASTVKAIVGQRLVRRLCESCRVSAEPSAEEAASISELFKLKDDRAFSYINNLEALAKKEGVGGETPLATNENKFKAIWKASPKGCKDCNNTGYKGRVGVYEVLDTTRPVQKLIMANSTSNEIQDQAIEEGMITMQIDGLIKALRGNTTIEEVLRVTKE